MFCKFNREFLIFNDKHKMLFDTCYFFRKFESFSQVVSSVQHNNIFPLLEE